MQMPGSTANSGGYRFGFNGVENDNEVKGNGNSIDFKYRMYDSRIARFFAVDPLTQQYPYWTPYQFAGLMPIRFVELEGLEPGEPFDTPEAAADDFGRLFNDNSIRDNLEYGTLIHTMEVDCETKYTYITPMVGEPAGLLDFWDLRDEVPAGSSIASWSHTHAAAIPGNEMGDNKFSEDDKYVSEYLSTDGYVSTPNGSFKRYNVGDGTTTLVSTDHPKDDGTGNSAKSTSVYTIKSGDSLNSIAKRYHTTVDAIKTENALDSDEIVSGKTLNITN